MAKQRKTGEENRLKPQSYTTDGQKARKAREKRGLSQQNVSDLTRMAVRTICDIESGRGASASSLLILADFYKLKSWQDLLADEERQYLGDAPIAQLREAPTNSAMSRLDRIIASKEMLVGCISQPPLLDFSESNGSVDATGLYAMLIEEVARAKGIRIEYVGLQFHEMVEAVLSSKVDLVLCTFWTYERALRVDFNALMHRIGVGGVVRKANNQVHAEDDLRRPDIRVAVIEGEIGWEYARMSLDLDKSPNRFSVVKDPRIGHMMSLLRDGVVQIALADSLSCRQFCEKHSDSSNQFIDIFADNPIYICDTGAMFKKGEQELQQWLAGSLRFARTTPRIRLEEARIMSQYLGTITKIE